MDAISLFSGAGGFEIGFERAGIQTVLQAESDPWCRQVLARHWPDVERVTDVRSVARGIGSGVGRGPAVHAGARGQATHDVDLVYGGFPCQDLSVAGKRAGFRGERSSLWFEFHRVLSELRPRWTVVENVPGLLSSHGGADFGVLLRGLGDLGYGWAYRVLDARFFGVPQRRRRVFVVGCLGDEARAAQVLAVCEGCGGHPAPRREAGEGLADAVESSVAGTLGSHHGNVRADQAWTGQLVARALTAPNGPGRGGSYRLDDQENIVVASRVTNAREKGSEGWGVRRLTPLLLECNRLQGFPDDWDRWTADGREIPDSHRYRMMGNAVCVPVAEWLGHRLMAVDGMREADAA